MSDQNCLVDIPMCAYNFERFIGQAIEGVISQETSFKFRLIIGEDCSTDNTKQIVEKYQKLYSDRIKCIYHKKNMGAYENSKILFKECTSKYVALCDGDDYWIDPFKLQKQIEFLENNPDYSLCGHMSYVANETKLTDDVIGKYPNQTFTNADFSKGYKKIPTASIVFRNSKATSHPLMMSAYGGDRSLLFLLSLEGKIKVLDFTGSVYRMHGDSFESRFRNDKKGLAIRNIEENKIFLKLVDTEFKRNLSKKIRWNYFYLFLLNLKEIKILDAIVLIPQLVRFQLVVMGFHWAIPKS